MMSGIANLLVVWSLLFLAIILGFAFIVWTLASKETNGLKTIGQSISVVIAILAVVIFIYGLVYGNQMGRMMGGGMMGEGKLGPQMMHKMMMQGE